MPRKEKPIHTMEMRRQLDTARIYLQTVSLRFWKLSTGDIVELRGWIVKNGHWRGGTHTFLNPANGEMRKVRDITIFEYMNHEIYL